MASPTLPVGPTVGPEPAAASLRLPQPLTPFIGRVREIGELEELVIPARLVTIVGPGGSGKTRLALEIARRTASRCCVPVAFADFSPIADPALVPQVVGEALGLRDEGGGVRLEAIVAWMRDRTMLLVLDNCEHLVDAVASLAETLLQQSPTLGIVATSREPLTVPGERAWLAPPLSLPAGGPDALAAAAASEAVQLFVARAQDVMPSFALSAANVGAVVEICRRLDGIPLAIELAAARVRALGPEQIARRLDDAFALLTTGGRTALPRHRTLRATMEWSVRLLSAEAQALLRRLGVFAGGFTLEAVEAVCTGGEVPPDAALDLLTQLVDRSLVVARERETTARFHLLETVRQYALERLEAAGEEAALRAAHARHVVALADELAPLLTTIRRPVAVERIDVELDNVRQAMGWLRDHDPASHVHLVGALCWYWYSSRHWAEGRRWMEEALALPAAAEPGAARGDLLFALGVLAVVQGDTTVASPALEESVALARERGDWRAEAYATVILGMAIATAGGMEGKGLCERAGAWCRVHGECDGLRIAELILGTYALVAGDVAGALAHAEESLRVARMQGQDRDIAISLQSVAHALFDAGEHARGTLTAQESIRHLQRDVSFLWLARGIELVAIGACMRGAWAEGVALFAAGDAMREPIGARLFAIDVARYQPRLDRAREHLGAAAYDAAWAEGRGLAMEAAAARALALPPLEAPRVPEREAEAPAAIPSEALHVRALGPLEIHVDGRTLEPAAWRSARPRELFLYLALHPEGRTREQIGLAFWPDASAAQLRNSFHVTLHHVRKALGRADAVVIERDRYRLAPALGAWCDAVEFPRRLRDAMLLAKRGADARASLAEALALYRGDLFEGLAVGDWHLEAHDHLRRLAADGCWALAKAHIEAGDDAAAISVLERLVRLDDLREEAHRALMECHVRTGARSEALAHYRAFVAKLARELDAAPEPETVALHDRILRTGAP